MVKKILLIIVGVFALALFAFFGLAKFLFNSSMSIEEQHKQFIEQAVINEKIDYNIPLRIENGERPLSKKPDEYKAYDFEIYVDDENQYFYDFWVGSTKKESLVMLAFEVNTNTQFNFSTNGITGSNRNTYTRYNLKKRSNKEVKRYQSDANMVFGEGDGMEYLVRFELHSGKYTTQDPRLYESKKLSEKVYRIQSKDLRLFK